MTPIPPKILCFGEVLWDCLPSGKLPGGAPLNVAYHLQRLNCEVEVVSAVGTDALGAEMIGYMQSRGLSTRFIHRHESLPTGTVEVSLSAEGQPTYSISENVAWDDIPCDAALLEAAQSADAIVFGSLAARSDASRATLKALLALRGPLRFMDVNLRPPFDAYVHSLATKADWLKLNEQELTVLSGLWVDEENDAQLPGNAVRFLSEMAGYKNQCVTRGEHGAVVLYGGQFYSATAPKVDVSDTIGAGDAFTAAFLAGLLTRPIPEALTEIITAACELGALVASLPGAQPELA